MIELVSGIFKAVYVYMCIRESRTGFILFKHTGKEM